MADKFKTTESNEENARSIEVEFDFGGTTARAVELFGEEAVYNQFVKGAKVSVQGFIRAKLADVEMTDDAIVAAVAEWKPGTRTPRAASKTSKLEKLLGDMTAEEKTALIEKLMAATA